MSITHLQRSGPKDNQRSTLEGLQTFEVRLERDGLAQRVNVGIWDILGP